MYRHEEGAHYLYFYAPFSAWMIGSRPGSGSAALIAYDGADRPDLIASDAPWRVYDGRAWREVSDVRIRALAARANKDGPPECKLDDLPVYAWTPKAAETSDGGEAAACDEVDVDACPVMRRPYLVYSCCGDKAVVPTWLTNGPRKFDLWCTYYGKNDEDPEWKANVDCYRRRKGGKFENMKALFEEPGVADVLASYDGVWVTDDDVIIDAPRIFRLFEIRKHNGLILLQPAFDPRGKVSHAMTCVQPANQIRLTNFVEMTCPLFAPDCLAAFLRAFDPELKGWGADWWFLSLAAAFVDRRGRGAGNAAPPPPPPPPRLGLRGGVAVVDAITCINPTDADKSGVREINVLQGREGRRDCWNKIRRRENIDEWDHLQFDVVPLDETGRPRPKPTDAPAAAAVRVRRPKNPFRRIRAAVDRGCLLFERREKTTRRFRRSGSAARARTSSRRRRRRTARAPCCRPSPRRLPRGPRSPTAPRTRSRRPAASELRA